MNVDTWLTSIPEERFQFEIKKQVDISNKRYLCEIDPCQEKAIVEITVGPTQGASHGNTYCLCADHLEHIWDIYLLDIE